MSVIRKQPTEAIFSKHTVGSAVAVALAGTAAAVAIAIPTVADLTQGPASRPATSDSVEAPVQNLGVWRSDQSPVQPPAPHSPSDIRIQTLGWNAER